MSDYIQCVSNFYSPIDHEVVCEARNKATLDQIDDVKATIEELASVMLEKASKVGAYIKKGNVRIPINYQFCVGVLTDCVFDHQLFDLNDELTEKF